MLGLLPGVRAVRAGYRFAVRRQTALVPCRGIAMTRWGAPPAAAAAGQPVRTQPGSGAIRSRRCRSTVQLPTGCGLGAMFGSAAARRRTRTRRGRRRSALEAPSSGGVAVATHLRAPRTTACHPDLPRRSFVNCWVVLPEDRLRHRTPDAHDERVTIVASRSSDPAAGL